jgi:hypothetical protein
MHNDMKSKEMRIMSGRVFYAYCCNDYSAVPNMKGYSKKNAQYLFKVKTFWLWMKAALWEIQWQ